MEKKNNSGLLVGILIGIIIMLIIGICLFTTGTIGFKSIVTTNNENEKEISGSDKVENYISVEKVNIGDERVAIEKVVFKNLDSSLTQKYTEDQAKLIDEAESTYNYFSNKNENIDGVDGGKHFAKSNIWYQINKNILTVHYELKSINEIGQGNSIVVLNIDLSNKKLLTNEEVLKLGNSSYNDIATAEYNRVLDNCTKQADKDYCYYNKSEKKVTLEEHKNTKDTFIRNIEEKLDDIIKAYIQDGKVKYDYSIGMRLANETLYMGGPSTYETTEVGEYK